MARAPWPVMGSAAEQLLTRLTNTAHVLIDLEAANLNGADVPFKDLERAHYNLSEVLGEADDYIAENQQFVDRLEARGDMS